MRPTLGRCTAAIAGKILVVEDEDLVREIFVFGEPEQMKDRLARFVDGGITTLILTPIAAPDQVPALIDALAPAQ